MKKHLVFGFCLLAFLNSFSPAFPREALTLQTGKNKKAYFVVDLATTDATREYGLMFRKTLLKDYGMLFVFDTPVPAKFWMKNTLIPLDMLFFDEDGIVTHIENNATPQDLAPRGPDSKSCLVLELAGGTAKTKGFRVGKTKLTKPVDFPCLQQDDLTGR